jgi:hypothetical protein
LDLGQQHLQVNQSFIPSKGIPLEQLDWEPQMLIGDNRNALLGFEVALRFPPYATLSWKCLKISRSQVLKNLTSFIMALYSLNGKKDRLIIALGKG